MFQRLRATKPLPDRTNCVRFPTLKVVEVALRCISVFSLIQALIQVCDVTHSSELLLATGLHDCFKQAKALEIKKVSLNKPQSFCYKNPICYLPVSSPLL